MAGVLNVVRDGNFLGVIAEREGQARVAARALAKSARWKTPNDLPESGGIYEWLKQANSRLEEVATKGNVDVSSTDTVRATYQRPLQAHASISPAAAVALYDESGLTVWSHAQGMYPLREAIAHALDLPIDNVRCIHSEASGCFGHNGADDAACDAAALAMSLPGRPIRLRWERADEFRWEPFGPAMQIETQAVLDDDGVITDWQYDLWSCPHTSRPRGVESAGNLIYARHKKDPLPIPPPRSIPQPNGGADRNAVPLYDFDNVQVNKHLVTDIPVRGSSLRGLGAYANIFAIESFMDELAHSSGADPFEFRLRHLGDERAVDVLERLREESGWTARPEKGGGTGWGIGFARFKNLSSYLGVVMQLRVDERSREIELAKATAVCDAGLVINPDGLKAQIEGGIVQSASWTLKEQVRISSSQIETRDWSTYPILRFDEVPEVTVHLIDRPGEKSLGVGETAQGPTAAAIANAVFHATGRRLRQLPFTPDRLS
jgi:CO/xanthine dehydrogenase Mo-binding subunit